MQPDTIGREKKLLQRHRQQPQSMHPTDMGAHRSTGDGMWWECANCWSELRIISALRTWGSAQSCAAHSSNLGEVQRQSETTRTLLTAQRVVKSAERQRSPGRSTGTWRAGWHGACERVSQKPLQLSKSPGEPRLPSGHPICA